MGDQFYQDDSSRHDTDKCLNCRPAKCCSYMSMEIDAPDDLSDYENMLWYIAHQNIHLYVVDDEWFLNVLNKCNFLGENNMCQIYDRRPSICREHSVEGCEYGADFEDFGYDHYFSTFAELEDYIWQKFGKRFVKELKPPKGMKNKLKIRLPHQNKKNTNEAMALH
jgi:uncharacterized protein